MQIFIVYTVKNADTETFYFLGAVTNEKDSPTSQTRQHSFLRGMEIQNLFDNIGFFPHDLLVDNPPLIEVGLHLDM